MRREATSRWESYHGREVIKIFSSPPSPTSSPAFIVVVSFATSSPACMHSSLPAWVSLFVDWGSGVRYQENCTWHQSPRIHHSLLLPSSAAPLPCYPPSGVYTSSPSPQGTSDRSSTPVSSPCVSGGGGGTPASDGGGTAAGCSDGDVGRVCRRDASERPTLPAPPDEANPLYESLASMAVPLTEACTVVSCFAPSAR